MAGEYVICMQVQCVFVCLIERWKERKDKRDRDTERQKERETERKYKCLNL